MKRIIREMPNKNILSILRYVRLQTTRETYRGIEHIDMVPNPSPQNVVSVEMGKDFMLSHGCTKND